MNPGRYVAIPIAALVVAVAIGLSTRDAQERQYDSVRDLYRSHAAFAGRVVRASAQEAAWATGLVYQLAEDGLADLSALLGEAGPDDDCASVDARVDHVVVWATRTPGRWPVVSWPPWGTPTWPTTSTR